MNEVNVKFNMPNGAVVTKSFTKSEEGMCMLFFLNREHPLQGKAYNLYLDGNPLSYTILSTSIEACGIRNNMTLTVKAEA